MTNSRSVGRSAIEWVVFDLGGVVLRETAALPDLADVLGAPIAPFETAYYRHRRAYDRHSDPARYWTDVAADCGAARPGAALVAELTARDDEGWIRGTDPAVLSLIDDLRAAVRLAVLSNAPSAMGEAIRSQTWTGPFEHILISGDLGVIKPERAIYTALLRALGADAEAVVFVDDKRENVTAAAALGIRSVEFRGADVLRSSLAALGLPSPLPATDLFAALGHDRADHVDATRDQRDPQHGLDQEADDRPDQAEGYPGHHDDPDDLEELLHHSPPPHRAR